MNNMARFLAVLFMGLTLGAAYLTYKNVGLQETEFDGETSVRSGSHGGNYSSGGYNTGK